MPYTKTGAPLTEEKFDKFESEEFEYSDFEEAAKANGWLADGQSEADRELDTALLKAVWNNFVAYDEKGRYGKGLEGTSKNALAAMNILDDVMTQKIPTDTPYDKKYQYYQAVNENTIDSQIKTDLDDIYKKTLKDKREYERYSDPKRRQEINDCFSSRYEKKIKDVLMDAYDNCVDKDGKAYSRINSVVKEYSSRNYSGDSPYEYSEDRENCLKDIREELNKIPEDKRTDKQKDIIGRCNQIVDVDIPYEKQRREWTKGIFDKNGFYIQSNWLNEFYDMAQSLKDKPDHPFHKVIQEIEKGSVPEYKVDNVKTNANHGQSTLYTDLITEMIFQHAEKALENENSPEKDNLLKKIDVYKKERPSHEEQAKKQAEAAPYEESYQSFSKEDRKKLLDKAEFLINDGNQKGNGDTKEFQDLVKALQEAGNDKNFLFRQGHKQMADLDRAIQVYQDSEHNNLLRNHNVGIIIDAQEKINPEGAKASRKNLANDIYDTIKHTKKEWYDRKNTTEFNEMLDAMKTYCETDPDAPEFKAAQDGLEKATKNYLEKKKGGLGTEAHQAGGEERRQMAVLALSLVKPEEAQAMVEQANRTRTNKIDLEKLEQKTSGSQQRRKAAKEAKLKAAQNKRKRKAAKNKAKSENITNGEQKDAPVIEAPKI